MSSPISYLDLRQDAPIHQINGTSRPSSKQRIIRHTLEFSILRSLLLYGFQFSGFGLSSFLLQKSTNSTEKQKKRLISISKNMGKLMLVSLPFFYAKEVTNTIKKVYLPSGVNDLEFVNSLPAVAVALPIFYYFHRNVKASIKNSLYLYLLIEGFRFAYLQEQRKNAKVNSSSLSLNQKHRRKEDSEVEKKINNWKARIASQAGVDSANLYNLERYEKMMFLVNRSQSEGEREEEFKNNAKKVYKMYKDMKFTELLKW